MNLKKMMQGLVFFLTSLLVFVFLFRALLPTASPRMTKPKSATKEITYTYVALGDSLTEGVGDSTKQGGFVPILAQSLSNENDGQYQPVNYGVAGNTSAQILDRLKKQTDLQKDLKKARVMTLTVIFLYQISKNRSSIIQLTSKKLLKRPERTIPIFLFM